MTHKKEYKKYKPFEGFENLDPSVSPFERMAKGVYADMMSSSTDRDVKRIKDIMSSDPIKLFSGQELTESLIKRGIIYPILWSKFKDGDWDHKAQGKKETDQYYSKTEKNAADKPAAIFGTIMPEIATTI